MVKKILSLVVAVAMICGVSVAFAKKSEVPTATVTFEASEPDKDGYFTVDLIIKNATFKGFLSTFGYNEEVVTPIDFETKEASTDFARISTIETSVVLDDGTESKEWIVSESSTVKNGALNLIYILNNKVEYPNSVVSSKFQALAKEDGLNVAKFYFKKIADGEADFKLINNEITPNGFMLINSTGAIDCVVNINENVVDVKPENEVQVSDESETDEETYEKRVSARSNGVLFLQIGNYASVFDKVLKWIDSANKDVMPYIKDDRTMVPLRFIAEQLNSKVSYKEDTQEITIENAKTILVFKIGSTTYTNDGLPQITDTAPEIVNDRTFVPLRAVSEALDCSVEYLENDKIVVVTPKNYPWAKDNKIENSLLQKVKLIISPMVRDFAYVDFSQQ